MPGKGHSPEQVLNKLRQVEVAVAGGKLIHSRHQNSIARLYEPPEPTSRPGSAGIVPVTHRRGILSD